MGFLEDFWTVTVTVDLINDIVFPAFVVCLVSAALVGSPRSPERCDSKDGLDRSINVVSE
jgi:hypothetical protein